MSAFGAAPISDDVLTAERKWNDMLARKTHSAKTIYTTAKAIERAANGWLPHLLVLVRLPIRQSLALDALHRVDGTGNIADPEFRAIVVAEIELSQITRQVLLIHVLVGAHQSTLKQAEMAL